MKRLLTLVIFLNLLLPGARAQQIVNMSLDDFYREFKKYQYNENVGEVVDVHGSPWDKTEFVTGDIVTTSNQRYAGVPLRLNIYNDQIEFRNPEGKAFNIGIPELIDHIMIGNEKYIYAPYTIANRIEKGYFMVLSEGKALLLQKKNVTLLPAEPAQAYKDPVPARFKRTESDYYLRVLPAEAKRVRNKKELVAIVGELPQSVEEFLKKNKTRFNKAEELTELINFYNSLTN